MNATDKAKQILTDNGFNPARAPMRVSKLTQVIEQYPDREVTIEVRCHHMKAGGRVRKQTETQGLVYLGSTNFRHGHGRCGYQEQVYARVSA